MVEDHRRHRKLPAAALEKATGQKHLNQVGMVALRPFAPRSAAQLAEFDAASQSEASRSGPERAGGHRSAMTATHYWWEYLGSWRFVV
jgi:hypothetical protein